MAHLVTRLTQRFGIEHPILSAPMALAGGGALAAAVTRALIMAAEIDPRGFALHLLL